jgi:hypothetical protein
MGIELYYDKSLTKRVERHIDFGVLPAGQDTHITLFVKNNAQYPCMIGACKVASEDVTLAAYPKELAVEAVGELILKVSPSMTTMRPAEASVTFEVGWIAR